MGKSATPTPLGDFIKTRKFKIIMNKIIVTLWKNSYKKHEQEPDIKTKFQAQADFVIKKGEYYEMAGWENPEKHTVSLTISEMNPQYIEKFKASQELKKRTKEEAERKPSDPVEVFPKKKEEKAKQATIEKFDDTDELPF